MPDESQRELVSIHPLTACVKQYGSKDGCMDAVISAEELRNPPKEDRHAGFCMPGTEFAASKAAAGMHRLRSACAAHQRAVRTQRRKDSKVMCCAHSVQFAGSRMNR